jgi:hypothetical protein
MTSSEPAHERFFPETDSPALAPFTRAFMAMMFAHMEFERRVADLAEVITLDPRFGETKATVWSAKDRPEKLGKLCADHQCKHLGGLPEGDAIVRCLDEAFDLCKDRNWLAHGVWWRIDTDAGLIDVHAVRIRDDEPLSREFTVAAINGGPRLRIQLTIGQYTRVLELWRSQETRHLLRDSYNSRII